MTHQEGTFNELPLPTDPSELEEGLGERWIRAILLAGFLAVLALEAWLVWQIWLLYT